MRRCHRSERAAGVAMCTAAICLALVACGSSGSSGGTGAPAATSVGAPGSGGSHGELAVTGGLTGSFSVTSTACVGPATFSFHLIYNGDTTYILAIRNGQGTHLDLGAALHGMSHVELDHGNAEWVGDNLAKLGSGTIDISSDNNTLNVAVTLVPAPRPYSPNLPAVTLTGTIVC